jgi:serine/threonine protein kinase
MVIMAIETIKHIGIGAAKEVYALSSEPRYVYYEPRFFWSFSELKKELAIARKIKSIVEATGGSIAHLAVNLIESPLHIHRSLTVKAEAAHGNLETLIRRNDLPFTVRLDLCRQALEAFAALHEAGFVHGDIKPDNFLVYQTQGKWTLKLSDWGKTTELSSKATTSYIGSARFAPFEYRSSHAGDIYSLGLTLLRILEEAVLTRSSEEMLMKPLHTRWVDKRDERGFVKYSFARSDSPQPRFKLLKRIKVFWNTPTEDTQKAQKFTREYIDIFAERAAQEGHCSKKVAEQVAELMKQMTHTSPAQRPTAASAHAALLGLQQESVPLPQKTLMQRLALFLFS